MQCGRGTGRREKSAPVFIDKEELPVLVSNITSYLFREEWTHAFSD